MKQLLYHIIACCVAVLFFAACDKECDIPGGNVVGDGNSIILDLSSEAQPVSRAAATGAEVRIEHIDVLVFDDGGNLKHHERVGGSESGSGTIILTAKRSSFAENAKYEVHLIANSTADVSVFKSTEEEPFTKTKLLGMTQVDRDINMTGHPGMTDVPQTFLMDGIAYIEGAENVTLVVLNDGDKSEDTKLKATLRRAAAKLVIRINKGKFVEFNYASPNSGYYFRNMPYSTSVVTGGGAEAALRTPTLTNNEYFKWTQEPDDPDNPNPDRPYTLITVTAYAYAHSWATGSSLEKETRLIVNIPMSTIRHNDKDQYLDESGEVTEDVNQAAKDVHENSFYQIPVCRGTELERNTCYQVSLELNIAGGTDPRKPVELKDVTYNVQAWDEKTINIGGEQDRPEYLTLNEEEFEMHNMEDDHTTLQFASSSEVKATITKVYYIDKFGQEQKLENISGDEWGVRSGNDWKNRCTLRITPDEGINGKIDVFGDVPENNAVRYIEFTVTNKTEQSRSVTVAQYPLEYITNIQGHYSYRSDFTAYNPSTGQNGETTYKKLNGTEIVGNSSIGRQINSDDGWRCACSDNTTNNSWTFSTNIGTRGAVGSNPSPGFFGSKVASYNQNGTTANLKYYSWQETSQGNNKYSYEIRVGSALNSTYYGNGRMYHVRITASSDEYTLGRPRIINGVTDPGKDNAKLVSPSFMIASQLGALTNPTNRTMAAEHCREYVEVDLDGNVYDDWRLPTAAEIHIIRKYQNKSEAIDLVLGYTSGYYWSASTAIRPNDGREDDGRSEAYIRCIRDAYDDKK